MSLSSKEGYNISAIFVDPAGLGVALAKMTGPILQALTLTANLVMDSVSSIDNLLSTGAPLHVGRLIVPVVVDSIDREGRIRSDANIIKEDLKRVSPSVAYGYPSAAIVWVSFDCSVVAALFHRYPSLIYRAILLAMFRMPMLGVRFLRVTTARCAGFVSEMLASDDHSGSASAFTFPHGTPAFIGRSTSYSQSSKDLSCSINKIISCHRILNA